MEIIKHIKIHKLKRKKNSIYYLLNKVLFIFLIKIVLINSSNEYHSEIHLTINEKGTQTLINSTFIQTSFEVLVNGVINNSCQNTCYLEDDINKVTLKFLGPVKSCQSMFYNLKNIVEVDLSDFDASQVTSMYWMFLSCSNLKKINFGNINTSLVENMQSIFNDCKSLISIDLSGFDIPNAKNIHSMFNSCTNLRFLNISHFNTSKVEEMSYMFCNCPSLIFLNLFKLEHTVRQDGIFDYINGDTKICADDKYTRYLLSEGNHCSDLCFQENRKIDIINNQCLYSCKQNDFEYEYNDICYHECPSDTYPLYYNETEFNENVKICFDQTPEGYYLDNGLYKKCFDNCKYCYGQGNETINNCIECKSNFRFLNESLINNNCYQICNYYYYWDEFNIYHCTENDNCPLRYNKLIINKNKCIDVC